MSVKKRTSKVVSYNEEDDDDDFIPIVDNTKKNCINKPNDSLTELNSSKGVTKQPLRKHDEKSDQEKPKDLPEQVTIEISDEESTTSQSTVSSDDNKTSDVDDQDENLSPKSKRMKHDEEDDTNENEETIKKTEIPTMSSIDFNTSRNCLTRISDLPKRNSSVPLGFPTSKITIPSPHTPRVGLSRKSLTIKPLHPNYTSRIVHD